MRLVRSIDHVILPDVSSRIYLAQAASLAALSSSDKTFVFLGRIIFVFLGRIILTDQC
jgi:hypothetical protein